MGPRKAGRLLVEERRRRIRELIEKNEGASTSWRRASVSRPSPSAATWDALAAAGVLVRSHGGALRRDDGLDDILGDFENAGIAIAEGSPTGRGRGYTFVAMYGRARDGRRAGWEL
jgi:hypothetical protein